jgi:uncharacterized repeat protein (TIGR01451 family)
MRVSQVLCASALVVLLSIAGAAPALATVDNTVTASATAPAGPAGAITNTATAKVDVQDNAPAIAVVRSWTFAPGGDVNSNGLVDAGDQIVYSYAVRNSGNVTLDDVYVNDVHDGIGAPLSFLTPVSVTTDNGTVPAGTLNDSSDSGSNDGDWDRLGPNDIVTFTSQPYTVEAGDLAAPTSADRDLDGTVTASGSYNSGSGSTTVGGTNAVAVPLNIVPSLEVTKVADQTSNVPAGTTITYTYHVRNTGTVPIANVALHDTHKGVTDALVPQFNQWITNSGSSITGNTIDTLAPGDEAEFTATYVVTQQDIDTLQ